MLSMAKGRRCLESEGVLSWRRCLEGELLESSAKIGELERNTD